MKTYDSIPHHNKSKMLNLPILAFDKLDGSNIRVEYSHKKGFYKFGTRKQLINSDSVFNKSIDLFLEKYSEPLSKIFSEKYRKVQTLTCFLEFLGENSMFGLHDFSNDNFDIILFDVFQFQKGFISPQTFVEEFGDLGIPSVVYEGLLTESFIQDVKNNKYNLSEGVICKGINPPNSYCKIKTNDWLNNLKNKHPYLYETEFT